MDFFKSFLQTPKTGAMLIFHIFFFLLFMNNFYFIFLMSHRSLSLDHTIDNYLKTEHRSLLNMYGLFASFRLCR